MPVNGLTSKGSVGVTVTATGDDKEAEAVLLGASEKLL